MNDPANMSMDEARLHVWSERAVRGHVPRYAEAEGALRCAIAIKHGCVGLPKCNPAQCRCGAVGNRYVRRTWTPEDGWVRVEVRV